MSNECKALHETFVKELIDLIDTIRDTNIEEILDSRNRSKYSKTSLAKLTDNLVCVFPVMVSSSMSIDTAIMVMKAIERKAAVMLQLLFSAYQLQDSENLVDVLAQFHSNIKLNDKMDVDDVISVMDRITEGAGVKVDYNALKAIREDMRNIQFYFEENVNPRSLNDINISRDPYNRSTIVEGFDRNRRGARCINDISKSFAANDIKKANELMPTTLAVNFYAGDTKDHVLIEGAVIGVKQLQERLPLLRIFFLPLTRLRSMPCLILVRVLPILCGRYLREELWAAN